MGRSEQCFVCPVFFTVPVSHSESQSGGPADHAHPSAAFDVENDSRFAAASIVKTICSERPPGTSSQCGRGPIVHWGIQLAGRVARDVLAHHAARFRARMN